MRLVLSGAKDKDKVAYCEDYLKVEVTFSAQV